MDIKKNLTVLALGIALAACGNSNSATTDQEPANAATSKQVLFADDFSDERSGWQKENTDSTLLGYEAGAYRILVKVENWYSWAFPGKRFEDVSVKVDASKLGGEDDNEFGVICRLRNTENFYLAVISSDGYYAFYKREDGGPIAFLNVENMLPSESIHLGQTTNEIRLDCIGSRLTLFVNGEFVAETSDDSFASGDVGLYAGTFFNPGTDILFDNFTVSNP